MLPALGNAVHTLIRRISSKGMHRCPKYLRHCPFLSARRLGDRRHRERFSTPAKLLHRPENAVLGVLAPFLVHVTPLRLNVELVHSQPRHHVAGVQNEPYMASRTVVEHGGLLLHREQAGAVDHLRHLVVTACAEQRSGAAVCEIDHVDLVWLAAEAPGLEHHLARHRLLVVVDRLS